MFTIEVESVVVLNAKSTPDRHVERLYQGHGVNIHGAFVQDAIKRVVP